MTTQRFDTTIGEDDVFNVPAEPARSILDELKDDLSTPVVREPVTLAVPLREGISIQYSSSLDGEVLAGWRKRCMPRAKGGRASGLEDFDDLKFSSLVLANQAQDVIRRGVSAGLNFRDKALLEMLGALGGAIDGVRKMYGSDGHVMTAAQEVLEACGYGDFADDDDDVDPTMAL